MTLLHDPRGYRLLVAEDDNAIAELLRVRLSLAGYRMTFVRNGVEAVSAARESNPHAILLDVNMPELDGFGALRELKGSPLTRNIPVMMLTARNAPADVEMAIALGAVDFLAKPFADQTLLLRVVRLLTVKRKPQTAH